MIRKSDYSKKLLDPRWQKKRLEILNRDKFTCVICSDDTSTLHVHHKCYSDGEPWEIDNKHLVTLCASCHENEEQELISYTIAFNNAFRSSPFFADDLRPIACGLGTLELMHEKSHVVAEAYCYAFASKEIQKMLISIYQACYRDNSRTIDEYMIEKFKYSHI